MGHSCTFKYSLSLSLPTAKWGFQHLAQRAYKVLGHGRRMENNGYFHVSNGTLVPATQMAPGWEFTNAICQGRQTKVLPLLRLDTWDPRATQPWVGTYLCIWTILPPLTPTCRLHSPDIISNFPSWIPAGGTPSLISALNHKSHFLAPKKMKTQTIPLDLFFHKIRRNLGIPDIIFIKVLLHHNNSAVSFTGSLARGYLSDRHKNSTGQTNFRNWEAGSFIFTIFSQIINQRPFSSPADSALFLYKGWYLLSTTCHWLTEPCRNV